MNPDIIYTVGEELKNKLKSIIALRRALKVLQLSYENDIGLNITVTMKPKAGNDIIIFRDMPIVKLNRNASGLESVKIIGSEAIVLGLKKQIDKQLDTCETEAETLRQRMQAAWK